MSAKRLLIMTSSVRIHRELLANTVLIPAWLIEKFVTYYPEYNYFVGRSLKDTYDPIVGGASIGRSPCKVVLQEEDSSNYLVVLESGVYRVTSDSFSYYKPFRNNEVEMLTPSGLPLPGPRIQLK